MRSKDTAVAGNESNVVFWHLPPPSLTPHLHDRLCHRRHPPHIKGAQLAAAGIDGERAAGTYCAAGDKWAALDFFAEAVVLERDQHRESIAVVEFAEIDVAELDSRHLEGGLFGDWRAGYQGIERVAARMTLTHPQYIDGRTLQRLRALGRGHD